MYSTNLHDALKSDSYFSHRLKRRCFCSNGHAFGVESVPTQVMKAFRAPIVNPQLTSIISSAKFCSESTEILLLCLSSVDLIERSSLVAWQKLVIVFAHHG